jgi:hypothetical protein
MISVRASQAKAVGRLWTQLEADEQARRQEQGAQLAEHLYKMVAKRDERRRGVLLNGQHRLAAIVLADQAVRLLVLTEVCKPAFGRVTPKLMKYVQ